MKWSQPIRPRVIDRSTLDPLPEGPSIYIWRRCFPKDSEVIQDDTALLDWLEKSLSTPYLQAKGIRLKEDDQNDDEQASGMRYLRSRFLTLDGLKFGGGTLSEQKIKTFRNHADDITWRSRFYQRLISASELLGPVLYVGEADSLHTRIRDHLVGKSRFSQRLQGLGLTLDNLVLQYQQTPELDKYERVLVEQCLTHALVAPLTINPG